MRASLLAISLVLIGKCAAHPLCENQEDPWLDNNTFCPSTQFDNGYTCCTAADIAVLQNQYNVEVASASNAFCKALHQKYTCGQCSSYASHLFATTGALMLKNAWCEAYLTACKTDLNLPDTFCIINSRTPNLDYSYPYIAPLIPTTAAAVSINTNAAGGTQNAYPKVTLPSNMVGMYMRPGTNYWWVIDKSGRLVEVENSRDATTTTVVLDITAQVMSKNSEQGLLGLAFAPNFQITGAFYVHYIDYLNGDTGYTNLSRFTFYEGDLESTRMSEYILLAYAQPYANHNGGFLGFLPSQMRLNSTLPAETEFPLFFTTGDGGDHDDPAGRSQDLNTYFGKVLRLNVASSGDYTYPIDNPYYPAEGAQGLVYAYGLRNPWRCSFDLLTDQLWCGDVGQELREEVDVILPGKNYGWRNLEGSICNAHYNKCDVPLNYVPPTAEYCHDGCGSSTAYRGSCIIGGYVYRGTKFPDLYGSYVFADFETKQVGYIQPGSATIQTLEGLLGGNISAFGEDPATGELYAILMYYDMILYA